MKARLAYLIGALLVAACATPYQEIGLTGGVSAVQIDETTLRISGRGNGFTDTATIQNFVLLKAAEETARRGFDMFMIVSQSDASRSGAFVIPGQATSYTTGSATAVRTGNFVTATGSATTQTYYTPSQTIPFVKPGEDAVVKMYMGTKPADAPANLFVASEVITYLGPRVGGASYRPPLVARKTEMPGVDSRSNRIAPQSVTSAVPAPAESSSTAVGADAYKRGDYATALKIFRPLAEQGNVTAQFDLGVMYANGHGVMQDFGEAAKWYQLAAQQRDTDAQINLGNLYYAGRGVSQDFVKAYMWFNIASGSSNGEAARMNRDLIAREMTAAQVAQAQDLSRQCSQQEFKKCGELFAASTTVASSAAPNIPRAPTTILPQVSPSNSAKSQIIPLERDGGTYVAPILINGVITLKFTVDSGAADVSIPSDVFLTLIRSGTIASSDILDEKTYVLANGTREKSQTFRIRSLRIGDTVIENVLGSVSDPRGPLLLGQSFLSRLRSWSMDNTKHALIIN